MSALLDEGFFDVPISHRTASGGFPSAAYDNWKTTEPDDSEDVYYDTWAELEGKVARDKAWAIQWNAEQEERRRQREA